MVTVLPNFLTNEECDKLIQMIDKENTRSGVADGNSAVGHVTEARTSYTSNLVEDPDFVNDIKLRIANHLLLDPAKGESLQGQRYEPGQYFHPHTDYFSGDNFNANCLHSGNRTHTLMIYLNEGMEGGETNFPKLDLSFKPEKGTALVWPNMNNGEVIPEAMHEGSQVHSGTKYIITSWWREREWNNAEDTKKYMDFQALKNTPQENSNTFKTPEDLPRITPTGFKVMKCPTEAWNIIKEVYDLVKTTPVEEKFDGKETIIKGTGVTSDILNLEQVKTIRNIIHEKLRPLHEQWSGQRLTPTAVYGIRSYNKGATLTSHVDRIATHHISSIVIVDKDLDCGCRSTKGTANDWPLDIQDHEGNWHKVYAEVGDIILYESAICEHGRLEEFKGNWFRNFYVHYKLTDWTYNG